MCPLPGTLEIFLSSPLQQLATSTTTWILQCMGLPALAEGTTILLDENTLEVERACSGLRMLVGIAAASVGFILLVRNSKWINYVLLASLIPIALIANTVRLVITGLVFEFCSNETARHFGHDFAGWMMIPLALLLCVALVVALRRVESARRGDRPWRPMRLVSGAIVVATLIPAAALWHRYQVQRQAATFLTRAGALVAEEKWGQAVDYFNRYLLTRPDDPTAVVELALAYDKSAGDWWQKLPRHAVGAKRGEIGPRAI